MPPPQLLVECHLTTLNALSVAKTKKSSPSETGNKFCEKGELKEKKKKRKNLDQLIRLAIRLR